MKLSTKTRNSINSKISDLCRRYWDKPSKALMEMTEVMKAFGVEMDSSVSWNDYQETARFTFNLMSDGSHAEHLLVFSWFRFANTGRYEVTAYVS